LQSCSPIDFWNYEAKKTLARRVARGYTYYIGKAYRKACELGLKLCRVSTNRRVCLLKVDLWNEGIEVERDVLGLYERSSLFDLFGIDISNFVCSSAKRRLKNVHIIQTDIRKLPFRDGSFDIILDLSTLDHIPLSQVQDVLSEYSRVLKKKGVLVLIFWYVSLLRRFIFKLLKIKNYEDRAINGQYFFPLDLIKGIMRSYFYIIEEYCIGSLLNLNAVKVLALMIWRLPKRFYDFILDIEYSRASKILFKSFSGLYEIIGKKEVRE